MLARRTFVCALVALSACRTAPPIKTDLKDGDSFSAIVIYPFGFRWPEPAFRSFQVAQRMFEAANTALGDRTLLFAPPDYRVLRVEENDTWTATDVLARFAEYNLRASDAVVLRAWAEKRVASSSQQLLDSHGKAIGAGNAEETTYVATVQLLHPSSERIWAEVSGEAKVDPFAEKPADDPDPAPELTALVTALEQRLLDTVDGRARRPAPARDLGLRCQFNPQIAISYSEPNRASLELWLARQDALEADIQRLQLVRFANPGMSDSGASALLKMPGGLVVIGYRPSAPLHAGDLLLSIDGHPALPQTLQRARFLSGPIPIKVRRVKSGLTEDAALP